MKHGSGSTFKGGKPAAYKDVNNDMENEEQLYSSFFDLSQVHKIDVKMSESDWNAFMAAAQKEEWYPCDLVIDGVAWQLKANGGNYADESQLLRW